MPKRVPNQRTIEVKKTACNKNNLYATINLKALEKAAQLLKDKSAFKLYIYFVQNQHNYKFYLSSSDFMQWSGLSKNAYDNAFKTLIKYKYLVKREDTETEINFYDFYDMPKEDEQIIIQVNKS